SSPASPSCWPCSPSTCAGTACAACWIHSSAADEPSAHQLTERETGRGLSPGEGECSSCVTRPGCTCGSRGQACLGGQRPWNLGERFSRQAAGPSALSSVSSSAAKR